MKVRCALLLSAMMSAAPAVAAEPGPFVGVSAGVGVSEADSSDAHGTGTGVYARGDYLFWRDSWFTPILYSGLVFTRADHNCGVAPCDVSSQLVFAGARIRLMAPIPYVGPFFELGIGGSAGHMNTEDRAVPRVRWSGATYHVPFAIGIAFGARHQVEVAFAYMDHPEQHQTNGGVAVGLVFRLPASSAGEGASP